MPSGVTENSVAALKAAQELGVWGSEFDVYMTTDGVPVIHPLDGSKYIDYLYIYILFLSIKQVTDIISSLFRMPAKMLAALSIYSNRLRFIAEGVKLGRNSRIRGWVKLVRKREAGIVIGDGFNFTSGLSINRISRSQTGCICAEEGASITIGDNVGMSSPCLWSRNAITVGNNVNVGADCVIMDHDAHSLNYELRRVRADELGDIASAPIMICDDVLIGTGCYILKGVTIGARSIIGAGSVVTRDVPPDEVWAGNPARFIRKLA